MTHEPTYDHTTTLALSCYSVNRKDSLTPGVNESLEAGEGDRTLDINLGKDLPLIPSDDINQLASGQLPVCTSVCTSESDSVKPVADDARAPDPLKILAAEALRLSNADRQRLLVMLAASLGDDI